MAMPASADAVRPTHPMFSLPFRGLSRNPTIEAVYGMIVAQARSPSFYRDYGVPDTLSGRFDMIVLHLVLVLRRWRTTPTNVRPLGQQIFDRFCRDMDHNFREMGVGDLAVPKEMRRVAEAFYGRAGAYEAALADGDQAAIEAALTRNVFGTAQPPLGARRLAAYMQAAARQLAMQDPAEGKILFPDPDLVMAPEPPRTLRP
jgi:cytochrome b pre-mRNA-processing protein 3